MSEARLDFFQVRLYFILVRIDVFGGRAFGLMLVWEETDANNRRASGVLRNSELIFGAIFQNWLA